MQGKKKSQYKIVLEKDVMTHLLDKDLKTPVFRLLEELQKDMEKDKKTIYEQN